MYLVIKGGRADDRCANSSIKDCSGSKLSISMTLLCSDLLWERMVEETDSSDVSSEDWARRYCSVMLISTRSFSKVVVSREGYIDERLSRSRARLC